MSAEEGFPPGGPEASAILAWGAAKQVMANGRRQFLRLSSAAPLGLGGWLAESCAPPGRSKGPARGGGSSSGPTAPEGEPIPVPRVNGAINVQPARCLGCLPTDQTIEPALVALQLSAAYELGFDGIRITAPLGDRGTLLAAIPYVRAARAIGVDAVVLLADFSGLTLARALYDDQHRQAVLKMYTDIFAPPPEPVRPELGGLGPKGVGRIAFQILNEPAGFVGLPPDVYVSDLLTPCYGDLQQLDSNVIVVSAAETGDLAGVPRVRAMLEAGLEQACDRIAYHVYSRDVIPLLGDHVRRIVWVTESGAVGVAQHLPWVRDVFPQILAAIPDALRVFYFDLFDPNAGVYRVLDVRPAGAGFQAVVESTALHDYWTGRVQAAASGRPLLGFHELVPDIRAYFPTLADTQAYDAAPWK